MGLFKNVMKILDNVQEFSIWDKYTLKALINRKIIISDNVLNKYLRSLISKHAENDLKTLEFHSLNDNIIQLNAVTNKIGKVKKLSSFSVDCWRIIKFHVILSDSKHMGDNLV